MIPLGTLHVDGRSFRDEAGRPWLYVGMTASALFKRWLQRDGPTALVLPNLQQWRAIAEEGGYKGDIVLRVYRGAAEPNAFALDPWAYPMAEVTAFTQFCNERGFRVDWTCGDYQVLLPRNDGKSGRQEHINQFCNALAPIVPTNFVQGRNEPFKNGGLTESIPASRMVDPTSPWGTYLRDSGWYYIDSPWDPSTNLDFISFHTPRNSDGLVPKWVTKGYESAPYLWLAGNAPVQNESMGFDEQESGSRSTNPEYAMILGLLAAVTGTAFHSSAGHPCDEFGPITRACAVRYFAGAAGALTAI